jgi:hypothetical protein
MHLVALAGLPSGFAVFSGCACGGFTSTSGQQQNTPVKPHARDQGGITSPGRLDTRPEISKVAPKQRERAALRLGYGGTLMQQRHRFADAEWGRFRATEDLVGGCKLLHRAIIQNRIFNNLYCSETPQLGF